jgi:two-component system, NtrC family, response regulator AtoC
LHKLPPDSRGTIGAEGGGVSTITDTRQASDYRRGMPSPSQFAGKVLVADPDPRSADALCEALTEDGIECRRAASMAELLGILDQLPIDVVLADPALEQADDPDLLATLHATWPGLPLILATADAGVVHVLDAVRAGAAELVAKPIVVEEVRFAVHKALERVARTLDAPPPPNDTRAAIFGESAVMRDVLATLQLAAPGTATVLVRGESGTGKELIARAVHDRSQRRHGPFVKIDCASLPEPLLESELFGYERGAFTGAVSRKLGRVELADGGTLFLDEIGELPGSIQAKLLRLLQDREFERLGGTKTIKVDVRLVAATHRDLETMVERGQFRQDLFYRLNVVPLWLPPLRARRDDIELLALHFCGAAAAANGKPCVELDAAALKWLRRQRWPGNVRQLQNFIERLVVLSQSARITEEDVKIELDRRVDFKTQSSTTGVTRRPAPANSATQPSVVIALHEEVWAAEKSALERALRHSGGNRSRAARLLGISRSTLYAKLEEYGLL